VDNLKEEPYSDSPCSGDEFSHGHNFAAVPVQLMKSEPEVCLLSCSFPLMHFFYPTQ
jgi:hypothetical protein